MSLRDTYDFDGLVNEAERLVLQELEAQLAQARDLCTCQDCVLDMAAFALNNTRPAYRVSLMGSVYARSTAGSESSQDVKRAVREAIIRVKANPSHD
jgi:competence protein ComFB